MRMGRKPKLTDHQTCEAIKRCDHGRRRACRDWPQLQCVWLDDCAAESMTVMTSLGTRKMDIETWNQLFLWASVIFAILAALSTGFAIMTGNLVSKRDAAKIADSLVAICCCYQNFSYLRTELASCGGHLSRLLGG